MSDIHPGTPRDDAGRPPFTVEDTGSTTDAGDLVGGERARQNDAAFSDADTVAAADADREPVDTDPADTVPADTRPEDTAPAAAAEPSATTDSDSDFGRGGLASLDDDGSIGHVFDQTNGVIDGLDGDSDGSAESDILSSGERADENPDYFHDADVRGVDVDDSRVTGN